MTKGKMNAAQELLHSFYGPVAPGREDRHHAYKAPHAPRGTPERPRWQRRRASELTADEMLLVTCPAGSKRPEDRRLVPRRRPFKGHRP